MATRMTDRRRVVVITGAGGSAMVIDGGYSAP